MPFIADLHIHSAYSRATSPEMVPESLGKWAQLKGITVIGTGDFTHPRWFRELSEKLEPRGNGLFGLKTPFRVDDVPSSCTAEVFSDADGEGAVYEGSTTTNTDGTWSLFATLDGPKITATLTDAQGNTSEFSLPVNRALDNPLDLRHAFAGRVFERLGDESRPLPNARISLYAAEGPSGPGPLLASTASDPGGDPRRSRRRPGGWRARWRQPGVAVGSPGAARHGATARPAGTDPRAGLARDHVDGDRQRRTDGCRECAHLRRRAGAPAARPAQPVRRGGRPGGATTSFGTTKPPGLRFRDPWIA